MVWLSSPDTLPALTLLYHDHNPPHHFAMGRIVRVFHPWPNLPSFKWPDLFTNENVDMAMAIVAIMPSKLLLTFLILDASLPSRAGQDSAAAVVIKNSYINRCSVRLCGVNNVRNECFKFQISYCTLFIQY